VASGLSISQGIARQRRATANPVPLLAADRRQLRRVPLFTGMAPRVIDDLVEQAELLQVARDGWLFRLGERSLHVHLLLAGRVALCGSTPDQRAAVLEVFGPNEGLLDPSGLVERPYAVGARAIEPSRIARLPLGAMRAAMEEDPALANSLVRLLVLHWRLLASRIADQKLRSAPQRLAAYLVDQSGITHGEARLFLTEDRRTLASHLGMTPENLSRVIAQLRGIGVALDGRSVIIDDVEALRKFGCTDRAP